MQEGASFIIQCRANWFLGIRPADNAAKGTEGYQALVKIAGLYFDNSRYEEFKSYLMGDQYLIDLWAAHLILEYGQPDEELKKDCLRVITIHTHNPLVPDIAIQERNWLDNYMNIK
jgi:hypothetical protein